MELKPRCSSAAAVLPAEESPTRTIWDGNPRYWSALLMRAYRNQAAEPTSAASGRTGNRAAAKATSHAAHQRFRTSRSPHLSHCNPVCCERERARQLTMRWKRPPRVSCPARLVQTNSSGGVKTGRCSRFWPALKRSPWITTRARSAFQEPPRRVWAELERASQYQRKIHLDIRNRRSCIVRSAYKTGFPPRDVE